MYEVLTFSEYMASGLVGLMTTKLPPAYVCMRFEPYRCRKVCNTDDSFRYRSDAKSSHRLKVGGFAWNRRDFLKGAPIIINEWNKNYNVEETELYTEYSDPPPSIPFWIDGCFKYTSFLTLFYFLLLLYFILIHIFINIYFKI